MGSLIQTIQSKTNYLHRTTHSLPITQPDPSNHPTGIRKRLFSISLLIPPIPSPPPRSKTLSFVGDHAGSSIKRWWDWGWTWILPKDDEEKHVLGPQNRWSWRHVLYRASTEVRRWWAWGSDGGGRLPQTIRYGDSSSKKFGR